LGGLITFLLVVACFILWVFAIHWTRKGPHAFHIGVIILPLWFPFAVLAVAMLLEVL
jgi:hypothetical protein